MTHTSGNGREQLVEVLRAAGDVDPVIVGNGHVGDHLDLQAIKIEAEQPHDFAPTSDPDRMQRIAELTGATIRKSCADASKAVMGLVEEAEATVATIRADAELFVESLTDVGNAHADRIESALKDLHGVVATIAAERNRIKTDKVA